MGKRKQQSDPRTALQTLLVESEEVRKTTPVDLLPLLDATVNLLTFTLAASGSGVFAEVNM